MPTETKYIDYLDEDEPIPGQLYCCVSFVSPEGIKNCSLRGVKIRGTFDTRERAEKHADKLRKQDPDFDIFVGEVGKWLPWDPEPNSVQDSVYQEKELNDLVKGYKDNLDKAKEVHAQVKQDKLRNAAQHEETRKSKVHARLQKKLQQKREKEALESVDMALGSDVSEPTTQSTTGKKKKNKKKNKKKQEFELDEEVLEEQNKLAIEERHRLNDANRQINAEQATITNIDDQLAKIQELYKKAQL